MVVQSVRAIANYAVAPVALRVLHAVGFVFFLELAARQYVAKL